MYLMGPWWYGALEGQTKFAYSVTGLPSFNGVRAGKIEVGSLSIASGSKNPEAAWAFVKTVTDTKGQNIWSAVATPTRKSSLQESGFFDTPWKKDVMAMVEAGTWTPFTTAGAGIDTAAAGALDAMWAGEQSAQQATDEAAKKIAEVLAG
jgi:ABC-type glycerol-3-phosphate transport system substrate-binding protein